MFLNMIPVHMVEMAVMKIVNMAFMANGRVPAVRAVLVGMFGTVPLRMGGHELVLLLRRRSRCRCVVPGARGWVSERAAPFGAMRDG
jgi:hypothetical protein